MSDLLPIGSVVLLKDATKSLMIIGMLQVNSEDDQIYDYLAVPYPEGYLNESSNYLFNHDDIEEILFTGFDNDDRKNLINLFQQLIDADESLLDENNFS